MMAKRCMALLMVLLLFSDCKKEDTVGPGSPHIQEKTMLITELPELVKSTGAYIMQTTLTDAQYAEMQKAVGIVDVRLDIDGVSRSLPYTTILPGSENRVVYYQAWDKNTLTIYVQYSGPVTGAAPRRFNGVVVRISQGTR